MAEVFGMLILRDGRIRALVYKSFELEGAVSAHRAFEAREIVGRAVLMP